MPADLVIRGGRIFTGVSNRPFVSALAARGGQIVALGEPSDVAPEIGPKTRVVELAGRLAVPGFFDAHTHLLGAGLVQDELSLLDVKSPEECVARVRERCRTTPRGEWVVGRGWDPDQFPGQRWPHRRDLDPATPDHPVLLFRRDGHAAWVNGRALEFAEIRANTVDPPAGKIVRDERGEATGILLEEDAIGLVRLKIPPPSLEKRVRAAELGMALCREHGITSVHDDASYDDRLRPQEAYGQLLAQGKLTARVTLWQRLGRPLDQLAAERAALPVQHGPPRLSFGLLKGYLDGSLGSRTALLFEPYDDAPEAGVGMPLLDEATLAAQVGAAHAAGFQVGLHAIGDRAAAIALDAVSGLADRTRVRASRHRIEHAQVFRAGDIPRMGVLGVVASVQPCHLASDAKIAPARLGARTAHSYPWRALLDAGAPLAFGTDYPVEPIDPLRGIYCAVARRSPEARAGDTFHPEQRLTREEAIVAYTAGSAYAGHQERVLGRLAPGFQADVTVLSQDVFALEPEAIPDVRCDLTIVDGEVVYSRA
jgi:predicted amidohydrolase YtcJ